MRLTRAIAAISIVLLALRSAPDAHAQLPLTPVKEFGQTVTPVFEGWYRNPDGSFSISFGYYNRNSAEEVDVPIGADNFLAPGDANQGQPTHFHPRRHWGVFAVRVPADFGDKTLTWTIKTRGQTFAIPATLHPDWQIDALEGEAGAGNTPPTLKFSDGSMGQGPGGVTIGALTTSVGKPLPLEVWASDDGRNGGSIGGIGRDTTRVALTWFKHQGPGEVVFGTATPVVDPMGHAMSSARFGAPGSYVLRVRANDASGVANAGHAQCCWTNAFVRVTVNP